MARKQYYGIHYPFTVDNDDELFLDLNETYEQGIASQVMHVILTPKGQRLRSPNFGTDLIRYVFSQDDSKTLEDVKNEIQTQVSTYVPNVSFKDIQVLKSDDGNKMVINVKYSIKKGNTEIMQGTSIEL